MTFLAQPSVRIHTVKRDTASKCKHTVLEVITSNTGSAVGSELLSVAEGCYVMLLK